MRSQSPKAQPQTWKSGKQTLLVSEGLPGEPATGTSMSRMGTAWGSLEVTGHHLPGACGRLVIPLGHGVEEEAAVA